MQTASIAHAFPLAVLAHAPPPMVFLSGGTRCLRISRKTRQVAVPALPTSAASLITPCGGRCLLKLAIDDRQARPAPQSRCIVVDLEPAPPPSPAAPVSPAPMPPPCNPCRLSYVMRWGGQGALGRRGDHVMRFASRAEAVPAKKHAPMPWLTSSPTYVYSAPDTSVPMSLPAAFDI